MNGRVYREGEVFQPSCKIQCQCLDGGFNCIPLCQEDVRLPTPDCPFPRRVEIPGKCCPEWICESQDQHLLQDARAGKMQGSSREGMPMQVSGDGPFTPGCETSAGDTSRFAATQGYACSTTGQWHHHLLQPALHLPRYLPARNGARPPGPLEARGPRAALTALLSAEMWYGVFLWALVSSLAFHVPAALLALFTLRHHKYGRFMSVSVLLMGIVGPITAGTLTSTASA